MDWKEKYKKILFGLGFDAQDGHKRITKGKNFILLGGSKSTHGQMQEVALKFNEQLKRRHKTMEEISEKEFLDIADKVGLKNVDETQKGKKRF